MEGNPWFNPPPQNPAIKSETPFISNYKKYTFHTLCVIHISKKTVYNIIMQIFLFDL